MINPKLIITLNYHRDVFFREYWPTVALVLASIAAISATASVMLILGVRCKVRQEDR